MEKAVLFIYWVNPPLMDGSNISAYLVLVCNINMWMSTSILSDEVYNTCNIYRKTEFFLKILPNDDFYILCFAVFKMLLV